MTRAPKPPDRRAALAQYRRRAPIYDLELLPFEPLRLDAVAALGLAPGETVLDVGCGTGLSLPLLSAAVGPRGRVVGIEQSPEMAQQARRRIEREALPTTEVACTPVEEFDAPWRADAALFVFTHDVLQQPAAVACVLRHLKPRARVVACGLQWVRPAWSPLNLLAWAGASHSVTTLAGLDAPWRELARHGCELQLESRWFGLLYLARGRVR